MLTGVDADDYPVSIRVNPGDYDARTGTLPATFPAALHVIEAPANVLSHSHDGTMWQLNMAQIKGASRVAPTDGRSGAKISTLQRNWRSFIAS